ncbi:MAG TPA: rhomboid family intramembrane serine protease [Alphaproteobacteria bacterium]
MNTASPQPGIAPATSPRERMINVPPVTLILVVFLVGVHLWRTYFLTEDQDMTVIIRLGFLPLNLHDYAFQSIWPWISLVSYASLHFGWTHLIINATGLLAFGAGVERAFGMVRYLLVLVVGIIAGALAHYMFFPDGTTILGGISAGLSALFAVVMGLLQQRRGWTGMIVPSLVWIGVNIVIGYVGIPGQVGMAIAWVAHLGGFIVGLLALPCLMPAYKICRPEGVRRFIAHILAQRLKK